MINLVEQCFPEKFASDTWQQRLHELVPARADTLADNGQLLRDVRHRTHTTLKLADAQPATAPVA